MNITPNLVRELREKTGVGMMECKKALVEASGNLDTAIEYLRKQGLKALSKKEAHSATDGLVLTAYDAAQKVAVILEVNCETDFVAKNEDFKKLASDVADLIAKHQPASVAEVLSLPLGADKVSEKLNLLVAKIGEKMSIRRFVRRPVGADARMGQYVHLGSKIGVLVEVKSTKIDDATLKDLAMHIAASNPLYIQQSEIPTSVIQKEKEIYLEQLHDSGKTGDILEKIIAGKVSKYASEICLMGQVFVKDPSGKQNVTQFLKQVDPQASVAWFTRYQVGEGLEKKADDFASEVAKMAAKENS